jgi:signal transduction histidine kinase
MTAAPSPLLERLTLTRQAWTAGALATLLLAGVYAWWLGPGEADTTPWWAVAGGGTVATGAAAWAATRAVRAHGDLAAAARTIAQEPTQEGAALPLRGDSADVLDLSLALRRALAALRERIASLTAHNASLNASLATRTRELSSLQDLSIGLAQHADMRRLVDEALSVLEQTMAYSSASVWARAELDPAQPVMLAGYRSRAAELGGLSLSDLTGLRLSRPNLKRYEQIEEDGLPIIENRPRQSLLAWLWALVTDDARTSALYRETRSWMAVPLAVRGRVLGVLRVDHTEPDWFTEERVRLLTAVASQTALALRHAHLLARERDLAVAAERNRFARELHDAVSQTLFAANLVAGTLVKEAALSEAGRVQATTLQRLNQGALAELRMLMFELKPDALANVRLAELLQQASAALEARGEVCIDSEVAAEEPPPAQRIEVYRIAQEALANIARHSAARHVQLRWQVNQPRHGRLVVQDDGRGFDEADAPPGHFGLTNMRERAQALGGTLQVHSRVGEGTRIELEFDWA